jgi:hypothetical protein
MTRAFALIALAACSQRPVTAAVYLDLSALPHADLTPADLAAVQVLVTCDDGTSEEQAVSVDAHTQSFSGVFKPCGGATIEVSIERQDATGSTTILDGRARLVLIAGQVANVDVPAYLTGVLDVRALAACDAVFTRTLPASDNILRTVTLAPRAAVVLPVGDYIYTCGAFSGVFTIAFAAHLALVIGPVASAIGPSLVGDTFTAAAGNTFVALATFSAPVEGVDKGGVTISGGATVASAESADGVIWTITFSGLQAGQSYDVTYNAGITDAAGTPLQGAPVVHTFVDAGAAIYVRAAAGNDLNTGMSFAQAVASVSRALIIAAQAGSAIDIDVEEGTYDETGILTVPAGVRLLGGFTAGVASFVARTPATHVSHLALDGTVDPDALVDLVGDGAAVDGFWIDGTYGNGGFVRTVRNTEGVGVVSNNVITCALTSGGSQATDISVDGGNTLIVNNVLDGCAVGGGESDTILITFGTPTIVQNTINTGNGDGDVSSGVNLNGNTAVITNNLFYSSALGGAFGVYSPSALGTPELPLSMQNNLFTADLNGHELFWNTATYNVAQANALSGTAIDNATGPPANINGNVTDGKDSYAQIFSTPTEPVTDPAQAGLLNATGASVTAIGKDAGGSDCGSTAAPRACGGTTRDLRGVVRSDPPHVGAYEP